MKQKHLQLLLTVVVLLTQIPAYAEKIVVDNIWYELKDVNEAEVVSPKEGKYAGDVSIPPLIIFSDKQYYVTSIQERAFYECTNLKTIIIGDNVKTIGASAFEGCSALTSVSISNSVTTINNYAFYKCTSLTNLTIGNTVEYIGNFVFAYCSSLSSLTIPNSVKKIRKGVFYKCSGLRTVTLGSGLESIGIIETISNEEGAFEKCPITKVYVNDLAAWCSVQCKSKLDNPFASGAQLYVNGKAVKELVVPEGVTEIGRYAFANCEFFRTISIPGSLKSIGNSAFLFCEGLKAVYLTDLSAWCKIQFGSDNANPLVYAKHLFLNGKEIKNLVIPADVDAISNYCFKNCESFTSVDITDNVERIGYDAFYNCNIGNLTIGKSIRYIDSGAFDWGDISSVNIKNLAAWCNVECSYYNSNKSLVVSNPLKDVSTLYIDGKLTKDLVIPPGVTSISAGAFYKCLGIRSVLISESVLSIGDEAFRSCQLVNVLTIGNGVKTIGSMAFNNCKNLLTVNIPNNVTSVGDGAFEFCDNMRKLVLGTGIETIGNDAFRGCTYLTTLLIPDNVKSIGERAFLNCNHIHTLRIGKSVETIGQSAFSCSTSKGNQYLTSLVIPNSVKSIATRAFEYNTALTSVFLGSGLEIINGLSFGSCKNIADVYCQAYTIPTTSSSLFSNISFSSATLHVLADVKGNYEAADPWNKFGKIVALTEDDLRMNSPAEDEVILYGKDCAREYGEENPEYGYDVIQGAITSGEPELNCDATISSSVGNYTINLTKGTISNSDMLKVNGILVVNKAPLILSVGNYTKYEGEADPQFAVTYDGFKNGESENVLTSKPNVVSSATRLSPPGEYSLEPTGMGSKNYLFQVNPGILTILPKPNNDLADGDVFVEYTAEGKALVFKVLSAKDKTCQIGDGSKEAAIDAASWGVVTIPETIRGLKVTRVDDYAFYNCADIESVNIPNTVTYIGGYAFYSCGSLVSVNIPDGVTAIGTSAFYECEKLKSIDLPNSVVSIGDNAFYSCDLLANIHLSDNLQSIGEKAFAGCRFTKIEMPNTIMNIGDYAFSGCYYLADLSISTFLTNIGTQVFSGCKGLTSVTIPESVCSIGTKAFYDCTNLSVLSVSNSVESIGSDAFLNTAWYDNQSDGLVYAGKVAYKYKGTMPDNTTITLETGTKCIGAGCFANSKGLISISLPSSLVSIDKSAFAGCINLTSIDIPSSVRSIGGLAFQNCKSLTSMIIPESVSSIEEYIFSNCSTLTSVHVPSTVTNVGRYAFNGCSALATFDMPNSVTSIGEYAFSGCQLLTSIIIPASMVSIGKGAFQNCSGLKDVLSYIKEPFTIDSSVFPSSVLSSSTLYVPCNTKVKYSKTNGWKAFKKIVEMEPEEISGDANQDKKVDINDVLTIVNHISGKDDPKFDEKAADVNGDGKVDIADIIWIMNSILN